jgi:HEPN domain-containing protein
MKPETQGWTDKAEGDWKVARREMETPNPVYDVICFLAQQCAEKYLKAVLEEHNVAFRKTHDLVVLLEEGVGQLAGFESLREGLARLSTFGIAARYPGVQADAQAAEDAMGTAEQVRGMVRARLGLS